MPAGRRGTLKQRLSCKHIDSHMDDEVYMCGSWDHMLAGETRNSETASFLQAY